MADKDFLKKRVENFEAKLQKINKRIERLKKKVEEDPTDYYYKNDLSSARREFEQTKEKLEDFRNRLAQEERRAAARNIRPLLDFLEDWRQRNEEFYRDAYRRYVAGRETHREKCKKAEGDELKRFRTAYLEKWTFLSEYITGGRGQIYYDDNDLSSFVPAFLEEKMLRDLRLEADAKYDFLVMQIEKLGGALRDVSNLCVACNGELNGLVLGEKNIVSVKTVGAGGYNIQRFHFRTLVRLIKPELTDEMLESAKNTQDERIAELYGELAGKFETDDPRVKELYWRLSVPRKEEEEETDGPSM